MARWTYKTTYHDLRSLKDTHRIISCDEHGSCMVHDLGAEGRGLLEAILKEQGEEGWELVQCSYHQGELLCIWKRREGEA